MLRSLLTIPAALVCVANPAMAGTYCVEPGLSTDTVHFQSSAKLEFVEGITSDISGSVIADLDSMSLGAAGSFQVDLRTLKTGIDLRDEHMRERHLHTEKYPYAFFRIDSVTECPQALKFDSTYRVQAKGKFFLHGVWRPIMVTAELRRVKLSHDSESLYVAARFALKLDEFGVPRPKALFLKLAETINVEVIFTAGNNLASPSISLPDWPERK